MNQVELPEGRPAKSYHTGVHRECAIACEGREVQSFDAVFFGTESPLAGLETQVKVVGLLEPEVSRQHRDLMAALGKPMRQRTDLYHRASLVLEWKIGLHYHQNTHFVRRFKAGETS
jgi:hypothetical protein